MDNKDYYALLGITANADNETIKIAYRRAARKYHPDVSREANAEELFKAVNEAYEVLSNPLKREKFNRLYQTWQAESEKFSYTAASAQAQAKSTASPPNNTPVPKGRLGNLLDKLFGTTDRPPLKHTLRKAAKNMAQVASVRLTLEDVYLGATKTIKLPTGENVQVKIPQGIEDGKKIRLPGKGLQNSDLHLKIQLVEHPLFTLQAQDLHLTLPIAPWEAALGSKITIPGLGGPLQLSVPSNTNSGQKLRLKGQGMPSVEAIGDLIVTIQIETPPVHNKQERDFYLQMAQHFEWTPRTNF
ncbi:DnaJ C-terminal domain-containing protein [Thiofilum flexile]|uniref:DnaJ C-terminal domain-containing protein n=1 Tax=Thiofilum flexile TaxID=125627 RepID=UPI0003620889|nr:DnaJ C-terminal domain-containing protein [Thiofilum flexile]